MHGNWEKLPRAICYIARSLFNHSRARSIQHCYNVPPCARDTSTIRNMQGYGFQPKPKRNKLGQRLEWIVKIEGKEYLSKT
eukprot:1436539-Amphidinium_carterae.1